MEMAAVVAESARPMTLGHIARGGKTERVAGPRAVAQDSAQVSMHRAATLAVAPAGHDH
jgi:hypothetical protein